MCRLLQPLVETLRSEPISKPRHHQVLQHLPNMHIPKKGLEPSAASVTLLQWLPHCIKDQVLREFPVLMIGSPQVIFDAPSLPRNSRGYLYLTYILLLSPHFAEPLCFS